MIKRSLFSKTLASIASLALILLISACGGGGGGGSTAGAGSTKIVSSDFAGSVGDGPIVGATVSVYDRNGTLLQTVVSDSYAYYSTSVQAEEKAYPLIIEVNDGTDLVTGREPDFKLSSVVLYPAATNVNINPYTTFMVEIARNMPGGITAANISAAHVIVMDKLNFGLDPAFVDDPLGTQITDQNVAVMVKASEALGEMIRRTRDQLMAIGVVAAGDDVVDAMASDLADGVLDGRGGRQASNRVAAVAILTSAQVTIETLSNKLNVSGRVATRRMDDAIIATRPSVPLSSLTGSVPVNQQLLVQARDTIKVAQILSPGGELDAIAATLDSLRAGRLASDVEPLLPTGTSAVLNQSIAIAVAANDEQLNVAINGDGTDIPTDPPIENAAPKLSGTPATTILEDTTYLYQPAATDTDGDTLRFSIRNRPGWATFSSSTGQLSGTPGNEQVGTYSNIVITVSDGSLSDSVGPFSITVKNTNDAPSISGSPASSATAGGFYSFQPSASDPDRDDLTFSIVKQPSWADFNASSGRLSGTPDNGDAGTYDGIVISVSDGSVSRSLPAFTLTVSANLPSNRAPVIVGAPSSSVAEDSAYVFQPTVSDADGDKLTFSISNRPSWASFNSTGLLSGTPTNDDVGVTNNVLITVSDGAASASIGPFSITVNNTNDAPVISGVPASSVAEDSAYNFQPTASDPDSDKLTFSISNKPSWASFSSAGVLSGTPKNGDVGTTNNVLITVSDGAASASIGPFSITVNNTNDAPVISGVPASSVAEDSAYNFQPTASDPDSDKLTFSISNKPSWASFSNSTGHLTGTPENGDAGSYSNIRITVSDGTASDSVGPFSITVSNTNDAPVISGVPATSVAEDSAYNFQPMASDPDSDKLTFSISNRPSWASFNSTGLLSGTPTNDDVGTTNNILITVSDGAASASIGPFSIRVNNTNDAPLISGVPATSVAEDSVYEFQPTASDPDSGDSLSFSINTQPAWASFDDKTGRLYGTPKNGDDGSYNNIKITVSDGTASASIGPFNITVDAAPDLTGSFSVSWTAPVARADGTPISLADINGYRIHYGESSGDYPNSVDVADGTAVSSTVNDVPAGSYYVVMTTYDVDGRESGYSLEVSKTVQ